MIGTATEEEVLNPSLPICDAHHHLWNLPQQRYLLDEYLIDTSSGHNIRSSVFVEWKSHYREHGPAEMRPVGETEFAKTVADSAATRGGIHACDAIVGYADLGLGNAVAPVLEAHLAAGGTRFKGIRAVASWNADPEVTGGNASPLGLYRDSRFREGFTLLARYGLSFDAWLYQTQLDDVIDLARAFPHQPIVMNHVGGVLGTGQYAGRREELFSSWRSAMLGLSRCENVCVKLSGLGMKRSGFPFHGNAQSSTSQLLADAWRPWIESCIEFFSPDRCMFASNFPVDAASANYRVLWNAFKRIAGDATANEKAMLFHDTATRFYRIA